MKKCRVLPLAAVFMAWAPLSYRTSVKSGSEIVDIRLQELYKKHTCNKELKVL